MSNAKADYYRGDQASGITAPNLAKDCTFAEHICRARGKRTQFTSISRDPIKIRDFGDTLYKVKRDELDEDSHTTVEHEQLIESLKETVNTEMKAEKARALQALRRAQLRREGLIDWNFDISGVAPKEITTRAMDWVQKYFERA